MTLIDRNLTYICDYFRPIPIDETNKIPRDLKTLLSQNPIYLDSNSLKECEKLTVEYLQKSTAPDIRSSQVMKRLLMVAHCYAKNNPLESELEQKLYDYTMFGISKIEKNRAISSYGDDTVKRTSGEVFLHVNMRSLASRQFKQTKDPIWLERAFYHSEQAGNKSKHKYPDDAAEDYWRCSKFAKKLYRITNDPIWKEKSIEMECEHSYLL